MCAYGDAHYGGCMRWQVRGMCMAALVASASLCISVAALSPVPVAHATVAPEPTPKPKFPSDFREPTLTVFGKTPLSVRDVRQAQRAALTVGAQAFVVRNPMLSMVAYQRDGVDLAQIPRAWRVPMGTIVRPVELVRRIGGDDMAAVLERGEVALGETSAKFREAKVGDVITVLDRRSNRQDLVVGAIVPDVFTSDGDLLIGESIAQSLGVKTSPRVTFVGVQNDVELRRALSKVGFAFGTQHRMVRSGASRDPDSILGIAKVKEMFGEFAYQRVGNYAIRVDLPWKQRHIVHKYTYENISLTHNCHRRVIDAIQAALTEIDKAGLSSEIDIDTSNRYGGCHTGRFSRQAEKSFGIVSRHSWGIAFDVNTTTNGRGVAPKMNCEVVRIFRKHGFAWGGNFLVPDGMHFEYVGEQRDQMQYRSQFCPNRVK